VSKHEIHIWEMIGWQAPAGAELAGPAMPMNPAQPTVN